MTLKTRRYIFYPLTFLFFIVSVAIVLYSQGYRLDLTTQSIKEIGGIYVKSSPSNANIFLDGEAVKNEDGLIKDGTLVSGLSSGTYEVLLKKDGYSTWEKTAPVKKGLVSAFDTIILVPKDGQEKVADTAEEFFIQDGEVLAKRNGQIRFEDEKLVGEKIVSFNENGQVLSSGNNGKVYYLSDVSDLDSALNVNLIFTNLKETQLGLPGEVPIVKIMQYPYDPDQFVVMTRRALYTLDTDRLLIEQVDSEVGDFTFSGSTLVWYNSKGIFAYQLAFRNMSMVELKEEIDLKNLSKVKIDETGSFIGVLDKNRELTILDMKTGTSTEILAGATDFEFSPDGKVLLWTKNFTELEAYYLTEQDLRDNLLVKLADIPSYVDKIDWYKDNRHLFVRDTAGVLYFIEVDEYSPINIVELSGTVKKFQYDEKKTVYYDDGQGIWGLKIEG